MLSDEEFKRRIQTSFGKRLTAAEAARLRRIETAPKKQRRRLSAPTQAHHKLGRLRKLLKRLRLRGKPPGA
ncbi:MAG TPA: hypothetical protein VIL72_02855 [Beijerinckiaceae bacterium]